MSQRVVRVASKAGYSFLAAASTFAVLWPVSNAAAQESMSVPVPDMLVDFAQAVPLAALIAMLVEVIRLGFPWLSRKNASGTYNAQKNALRLIAVLLGAVFGALGWASAMGDGSSPRQLGGIAAGCVAALFGGQLMGAVTDRFKSLRSKK